MIFGIQSATNQDSAAQSVTLTPRLLKLLQEAMKKEELDPNELKDAPKTSTEPSNFQQLFGDASAAAAAAPAKEPAATEAPKALFAPKYKSAKGSDALSGITWKLNENYFADADTAGWIASKYGSGEVRESDMLGAAGPFSVDTKMYEIKLEDGRWVNAGVLASYYDRNPEALFPGLADKLIKSELAKG